MQKPGRHSSSQLGNRAVAAGLIVGHPQPASLHDGRPRSPVADEVTLAHIEILRGQLRYFEAEPRRRNSPSRGVLTARATQVSNSIEAYEVLVEGAVAAIEGDIPSDGTDENWMAVVSCRRAMTFVSQLAHDKTVDAERQAIVVDPEVVQECLLVHMTCRCPNRLGTVDSTNAPTPMQ